MLDRVIIADGGGGLVVYFRSGERRDGFLELVLYCTVRFGLCWDRNIEHCASEVFVFLLSHRIYLFKVQTSHSGKIPWCQKPPPPARGKQATPSPSGMEPTAYPEQKTPSK